MKRGLLLLLAYMLLPLPAPAAPPPTQATPPAAAVSPSPGTQGFAELKHCVMENNPAFCHSILTPSSYDIFDRFVSYKLMPCLPTDFVYESEETAGARTTVKATMPAGGNLHYILRLVFEDRAKPKLDIPESLHRGLGENWENKIQLAEQIYLMMRQNLGDKLTCDQLNDLIKK